MLSENKKTLVALRLEKANECLRDAELMINSQSYKSAANRSYFSVFHAMRAVLALNDFDSKRHTGIISAFREKYIKTGIFQKNLSDIINRAFDNRGESDYNDFYVISKDETVEQAKNAKIFLTTVEAYIQSLDCKTNEA